MSEVEIVDRIIGRLAAPTLAISDRFKPKPSSITAYCSTFFEVYVMPGCMLSGGRRMAVMTMPAKMANTGPPTMGRALPSSQQGMAISRHSAVPGAIFLNIVIKTSLSLVLFRTILPILHQVKLLIFILA